MPRYDDILFSPPAPVAYVTLRAPDNSAAVDNVLMLIDCGSDVTLLPKSFVEQLGSETDTETAYELAGFDGNTSVSCAVNVHLIFLRKAFKGHFLLFEQDYGILGRNVLNRLRLFLDGPQEQWDER